MSFDEKRMQYDNSKPKWEKQINEPTSAYKYFSLYLIEQVKNAKDPLEKVCTLANKKINYIRKISNLYNWKERADSYNQFLAEQNRKKLEREYEKYCNDTVAQIMAMSQIIGQKINADIKTLKEANGDKEAVKEAIGNMPMNQVAQILKTNQEVLKTILRIPDAQEVSVNGKVATTVQQIEEDMTDKLSKLSPEKREEYLALQAELNDEPTD